MQTRSVSVWTLCLSALLVMCVASCERQDRQADPDATSTTVATSDGNEGSVPESSGEKDSGSEGAITDAEFDPQNAQDCGPALEGWRVVLASGESNCETAREVVAAFAATTDVDGRVPQVSAKVAGGWECEPVFYERHGADPRTYSMWCTSGDDAVLTLEESVPVLEGTYVRPYDHVYVKPGGYTGEQWAFSSPSGRWGCSIIDDPAEKSAEVRGDVGCHGGFPPEYTSDSNPEGVASPVNTVGMYRGSEPELWINGDVRYYDGPTLEYGEVLYAFGFACTVEQEAGVTCLDGDHGFTVSSQAVELH